MNQNEIKKSIYKQQPKAWITCINDGCIFYMCHLKDGSSPTFKIPMSEVGATFFEGSDMPAKLLIRWIE